MKHSNDQIPVTTSQLYSEVVSSSSGNCGSTIREFNENQHKRKYRVGVDAIHGFEAAASEYNLTFAKYLTATAGRRFDPPIEFEIFPTSFEGLFEAVEVEDIDFFYVDPGAYSCIGIEHGAQPLATIVSRLEVRGHTYDLDVFGGVMFTLADNDDINFVTDFKDKIIGAGGISMLMAGQLQFYEMEMAGLSYVMDPKQVVLTGNQADVVHGVLNGDFDVGFVRYVRAKISQMSDGSHKKIHSPSFCGFIFMIITITIIIFVFSF